MPANNNLMNTANISVSAVLVRVRMPVEALAVLKSGDTIDVEPDIGAEPVVRLVVQGRTVALATITEKDGVLCATISQLGSESDREFEKWDFGKREAKAG